MAFWRRLFSVVIGACVICSPIFYFLFQSSEWNQYRYLTALNLQQDHFSQIKVSTPMIIAKDWIFTANPVTKVYELDGKPVIWHYYDRENMPLYVRLLIEGLQCRNPEFQSHIVHQSTIYNYLPDLEVPEEVLKILEPAHQADVFRLAILRRFGGVYADADVYALDKVYPLYQLLSEYDIVIGDWTKWFGPNGPTGLDVAFGGMGPTRPNISFWEVWYQEQMRRIKKAFPHGAVNITKSPFRWTYLLYEAEFGIKDEILTGRTKFLGFDGPLTVNQLIARGLAHGSMYSWSSQKARFLPLNWSPFLFVWGYKLRLAYSDITRIDRLITPAGSETIYSAFVSCALLDCFENFTKLLESGATTSPLGRLNLKETVEVLKTVDRKICESIRNETKFDLEKFIVYDGLRQNRNGNSEGEFDNNSTRDDQTKLF